MTTWGSNIKAVEIDGVFDDCQALVKEAFLDKDLSEKYNFSSANSINIARLIPQTFYYFEAYKQLSFLSEKPIFVVPSGNFGNITAGLMATKLGLPVEYFVAAINANQTFLDYLNTGNYFKRPSIKTISNAMDVGDPSNFPRLENLSGSTWNMVKENFRSYSFNDEETYSGIQSIYSEFGYICDPHSAVGYLAAQQNLQLNPNNHHVVLGTAPYGKFKEVVDSAIGYNSDLPARLERFNKGAKSALYCSSSYPEFKKLLMNN